MSTAERISNCVYLNLARTGQRNAANLLCLPLKKKTNYSCDYVLKQWKTGTCDEFPSRNKRFTLCFCFLSLLLPCSDCSIRQIEYVKRLLTTKPAQRQVFSTGQKINSDSHACQIIHTVTFPILYLPLTNCHSRPKNSNQELKKLLPKIIQTQIQSLKDLPR